MGPSGWLVSVLQNWTQVDTQDFKCDFLRCLVELEGITEPSFLRAGLVATEAPASYRLLLMPTHPP